MSSPVLLTKDTLIPIGAVIIVLSAAFSYGIMYNKVSTLTVEVLSLRDDVKDLSNTVARLVGTLEEKVSYAK